MYVDDDTLIQCIDHLITMTINISPLADTNIRHQPSNTNAAAHPHSHNVQCQKLAAVSCRPLFARVCSTAALCL